MSRQIQAFPAGVSTSFELALRFATWAGSLNGVMTPKRIADKWGVSRATSYRWLRAFKDASGVGA